MVTPTPTSVAAMIVRGRISRGPSGSENPSALNSTLSSTARPMPANNPMNVATTPITSASPITEMVT
ncbi:unannotated protein [freshwater metagenome]|uniref:Unannotated protein n=1 Tax=freshwater metagenome TaxID=449393 RepID=A0A6J6T8N0_9ZZZZ